MRRAIVIAVAGLGLGRLLVVFHCDSSFKSPPPTVQVQLDRAARRRRPHLARPGLQDPLLGPVPRRGGFTVTFTLNKFLPTTVPVQVISIPGDSHAGPTSSIPIRWSRNCSRPGRRRRRPEADAAEKAEAAKTAAAPPAVAVPRPGGPARAAR